MMNTMSFIHTTIKEEISMRENELFLIIVKQTSFYIKTITNKEGLCKF